MQATLTLESDGKVILPEPLRKRYGFEQNVPIQVIETASGILLVPLTNETMSAELQEELAAWQSLSAEIWNQLPYDEANEFTRRT